MLWPFCVVGKEVDEAGHVVVDHERQIGLGGGQIGLGLGNDVGIDLEGDVAGHIGRRGLNLGHKAVALLQRFHLQRVDPVDDVVEFVLQLWSCP